MKNILTIMVVIFALAFIPAASYAEWLGDESQGQGTMSAEQVQAIIDMKLTRQDSFKVMQDLGIASANRPNASGTPRASGQGGNFQGGGNGVPGAPGRKALPGRPLHGREFGDYLTVKIPGEIDVQRVRRILE